MLSMQIRRAFKQSLTFHLLNILFADRKKIALTSTLLGSRFQKIYYPYVTEFCLFFSIILFWYKGFLAVYLPFLASLPLPSALIIIALLFADKQKIRLGKVHLWLLLFVFISSLSGLLAVIRGMEWGLIFSGWLLFVQFFVALIAAQALKETFKESFIKIMFFVVAILALVGFYQYLAGVQTPPTWVMYHERELISTRSFAFFGSPNILGVLLGMFLFSGLFLYKKNLNKIYLLILTLMVLVIGFTFSRSAWLGVAGAFIFLAIVFKKRLLLFSPLLLMTLFIETIRERLSVLFSFNYLTDAVLDGRLWAMINGLYIFNKYPLLGTGPGTYGGSLALLWASPVYLEGIHNGYTALYFTDNQFLQMLVQFGILGLIVFLGFVVAVIWSLILQFRLKKDIMGVSAAAGFVSFLVAGFFANVLEFGALSIPMAVMLGVNLNEE